LIGLILIEIKKEHGRLYKEKLTEISWQYVHLLHPSKEEVERVEVDRMPINSVNNPLLSQHASTTRSIHPYICMYMVVEPSTTGIVLAERKKKLR
jgi:hypothetical protein